MADDWLAVLALGRNDDVESVSSSPERGRSRSRSRSDRLIRPPPSDAESSDVDAEDFMVGLVGGLGGVFHEESPPSVSDHYIQDQIVGGIPLIFTHRRACVSQTLMQINGCLLYRRRGVLHWGHGRPAKQMVGQA